MKKTVQNDENNPWKNAVGSLLETVFERNASTVSQVAKRLSECLEQGGILYVFGSGHASLLVEEAFHRAGGLVPVYPVLESYLSPHVSPKIAGKLERLEGIAPIVFARLGISKNDLMWISSNSGINAAALEMAAECRQAGVSVIVSTSLEHSRGTPSRHSSGKKLFELGDLVLDNCCPSGDALVEFGEVRACAGSTIANSYLYHWVVSELCRDWQRRGKKLPIYRSANLPGGDAHNEALEAGVRPRIPRLL